MGYRRKKEDNRKLKKLYNKTRYSCRAGAWYDESKGRYIKFSAGTPKMKKRLKKCQAKRQESVREKYRITFTRKLLIIGGSYYEPLVNK